MDPYGNDARVGGERETGREVGRHPDAIHFWVLNHSVIYATVPALRGRSVCLSSELVRRLQQKSDVLCNIQISDIQYCRTRLNSMLNAGWSTI